MIAERWSWHNPGPSAHYRHKTPPAPPLPARPQLSPSYRTAVPNVPNLTEPNRNQHLTNHPVTWRTRSHPTRRLNTQAREPTTLPAPSLIPPDRPIAIRVFRPDSGPTVIYRFGSSDRDGSIMPHRSSKWEGIYRRQGTRGNGRRGETGTASILAKCYASIVIKPK